MFSAQLFLGFPVDQIFAQKLDKANPNLVKEFIREDGEYLCALEHKGLRYLGKHLGAMVAFPQLEMMEKNIYSLLKRLVPEFPYDEAPLYLISMLDDNA